MNTGSGNDDASTSGTKDSGTDATGTSGEEGNDASAPDGHKGATNPKRWSTSKKVITLLCGSGIAAAIIGPIFAPSLGDLGNRIKSIFNRPSGPPVEILLVSQPFTVGFAEALPVPPSAAELEVLNSLSLYSPSSTEWFARHDAAEVGSAGIGLVVQGNRDNGVRIVNIQPVAVNDCSAPPLTGALFFEDSAGGDMSTRLALDLDNPLKPAGYYPGPGNDVHADYFGNYTVSLKRGEQFTFDINARTNLHFCEFTLNMTILDGSHTVSEMISDNGRPFRVTAGLFTFKPGGFAHYKSLYLGPLAGAAYQNHDPHSPKTWTAVNPSSYHGQ